MSKLLILTGKLKLLLGFNIVMFNYLNLVVERKVYVDYMTRLNPYSNYMRKQFLENSEKIHPYTLRRIKSADIIFNNHFKI